MADYFEVDFLPVGTSKSGDAITVRYKVNGICCIHVVDGGYQETGDSVVAHINKYYDSPAIIDHVIVTHPDGDHAGGLRRVLENFAVGVLWMNRPWLHAADLIDRFSRFTSVESLERRLKELYPSIAALEDIAIKKGIEIREAFQGEPIGEFVILSPSRERYLDLIVDSDRTPEEKKEQTVAAEAYGLLETAFKKSVDFIRGVWGDENFSNQETSSENEMSVIQFAELCGKKILLTGDAGRIALADAADFAPMVGLELPGIDRMQIPHHGSRRNVSTEILDRWLGRKLPVKPAKGEETFTAIVSAAKDDHDHPRKAVVRGFAHRGAAIKETKGKSLRTSHNAPHRDDWSAAPSVEYPEDQEA